MKVTENQCLPMIIKVYSDLVIQLKKFIQTFSVDQVKGICVCLSFQRKEVKKAQKVSQEIELLRQSTEDPTDSSESLKDINESQDLVYHEAMPGDTCIVCLLLILYVISIILQ